MSVALTRRAFIASMPIALAGCVSGLRQPVPAAAIPVAPQIPDFYRQMYGPIYNEPFPIGAVDLTGLDPRYYRQEVFYATPEPTGTIVVDTAARYLYLVGENSRALRYGVGVGLEGLAFEGVGVIQRKAMWPSWRPTTSMIAREPERYGPLADGMPPGPMNPLGSRALYLYRNGVDTLFRIHGSMEVASIGRSVSSGCIRLLNQDVIDLYGRVPIGSRVVVVQQGGAFPV
ncbi:MAG: L,D-transpeptidase [Bauldia sp.]|nr:L,D-transpeptidase [Bauldia sp.]